MKYCDECGKPINRHGGGHKPSCKTGQRVAAEIEQLRERLKAELESEASKDDK